MVDLARVPTRTLVQLRRWAQAYATSGNPVEAWRLEADARGLLRLHGDEWRGDAFVEISAPVVGVDVRQRRAMTTLGWRTLGESATHGYPPDVREDLARAEAWCAELRLALAFPGSGSGSGRASTRR